MHTYCFFSIAEPLLTFLCWHNISRHAHKKPYEAITGQPRADMMASFSGTTQVSRYDSIFCISQGPVIFIFDISSRLLWLKLLLLSLRTFSLIIITISN